MNQGENKYYKLSHISKAKFRQLFPLCFNTFYARKIINISHRSCKVIYAKLRFRTAIF